MVGRVRIITSLWRTGDDRTLPLLLYRMDKVELERLSGKCSAGVMMAYAPRHGEQEIPYGSVRRPMAFYRPVSTQPTGEGRPRLHGLRAILDAVFYVLKSGCPWRMLPRDFPSWKTVYDWFRRRW